MSTVSFRPGFVFPQGLAEGALAFSSRLLNDSGIKIAGLMQAPKSGVLDKFELRTGNTSSINASSAIRFSFQDLSSSDKAPDGIIDQFRDVPGSSVPGTHSWFAPGLMTDDGTDGGNKRTVNRGDLLACVLEYQTFTAGDSVAIAFQREDQGFNGPFAFPLLVQKSGGSWSLVNDAGLASAWMGVLKYSDGSYEVPAQSFWPTITQTPTVSFNSGSSPDERGLLFRVPKAYIVDAFFFRVHPSSSSADFDIILYDSGDSVVQSVSFDATHVGQSASGRGVWAYFTDKTLLADQDYRLVVKPTTANDVDLFEFAFASAAIKNAIADGSWKHTSRTDGGAWTDTETLLPAHAGLQVIGIEL